MRQRRYCTVHQSEIKSVTSGSIATMTRQAIDALSPLPGLEMPRLQFKRPISVLPSQQLWYPSDDFPPVTRSLAVSFFLPISKALTRLHAALTLPICHKCYWMITAAHVAALLYRRRLTYPTPRPVPHAASATSEGHALYV